MQLLLIAEPDNRAEPVDSGQEEVGRGHRTGWGAADRGTGSRHGSLHKGPVYTLTAHPWNRDLAESSRVRKWVPPKCSARRPSICSRVERSRNTAYSLSWSSPLNSR